MTTESARAGASSMAKGPRQPAVPPLTATPRSPCVMSECCAASSASTMLLAVRASRPATTATELAVNARRTATVLMGLPSATPSSRRVNPFAGRTEIAATGISPAAIWKRDAASRATSTQTAETRRSRYATGSGSVSRARQTPTAAAGASACRLRAGARSVELLPIAARTNLTVSIFTAESV